MFAKRTLELRSFSTIIGRLRPSPTESGRSVPNAKEHTISLVSRLFSAETYFEFATGMKKSNSTTRVIEE